jgi:hypothetical protein
MPVRSAKQYGCAVVGFELPALPDGHGVAFVDAPEGLDLGHRSEGGRWDVTRVRWDVSIRAEGKVTVSFVSGGVARLIASRVDGALLADLQLGDVAYGDQVEISGGGSGAVVFRERQRLR